MRRWHRGCGCTDQRCTLAVLPHLLLTVARGAACPSPPLLLRPVLRRTAFKSDMELFDSSARTEPTGTSSAQIKVCARRRIQAREHTRVGRRDRRFKRPADEKPTTPIAIGLKCSAPARQGVVRRGWCGCRDHDHTARVYGCAARPPLSGACVPKAVDTRPWRLRHRAGSCLCDTKGKPLSWLVSASFYTPQ